MAGRERLCRLSRALSVSSGTGLQPSGFSLGVLRGNGLLGGLAAWFAFTMPSALILFAFAMGAAVFTGPVAEGFLHGLKLVAVAVVSQAVWGMTRTLTPDRARAGIALAAIAIVALFAGSFAQITAIAFGACAGLWLCQGNVAPVSGHLNFPVTRLGGAVALSLFAALLLLSPLLTAATGSHGLALFDAFYRSGALVFGGGHVVLPLLQAHVVAPGWVSNEAFLAGYGLAPGPLFTFAAYLGAMMVPAPSGLTGAVIALVALMLPGLLIVYGMLPFWDALRTRPAAQAAMRGTNAAVVGILGAALYNPVWTTAILTPRDFAVALGGFLLLTVWRMPPWFVVSLLAVAGALSTLVLPATRHEFARAIVGGTTNEANSRYRDTPCCLDNCHSRAVSKGTLQPGSRRVHDSYAASSRQIMVCWQR
jgi:chromate transporter